MGRTVWPHHVWDKAVLEKWWYPQYWPSGGFLDLSKGLHSKVISQWGAIFLKTTLKLIPCSTCPFLLFLPGSPYTLSEPDSRGNSWRVALCAGPLHLVLSVMVKAAQSHLAGKHETYRTLKSPVQGCVANTRWSQSQVLGHPCVISCDGYGGNQGSEENMSMFVISLFVAGQRSSQV
jgi:hypothetical protein